VTPRATPLLLLHTWGGDAATFGPSLPHLDAGGRLVKTIDLPGHGLRAHEPFSLTDAVATAAAALDRVDRDATDGDIAGAGRVNVAPRGTAQVVAAGRAVDVVGLGLGALVGLALVQQRRAGVRSLTVVGFPPVGGPAAASRLANLETVLRDGGTARFAHSYVDGTLLTTDPARRDLLRRAIAATCPDALLDALRATLSWADHAPPLRVGLPCHVLRGERDDRVSADAVATLAGQLGGTHETVPEAGHVAYLDQPEAFAATLAAFHTGLDAAAGELPAPRTAGARTTQSSRPETCSAPLVRH
jgi:pimeloyl-ACP methyl ester carboxylesterase